MPRARCNLTFYFAARNGVNPDEHRGALVKEARLRVGD
jgi:hypothetical protein